VSTFEMPFLSIVFVSYSIFQIYLGVVSSFLHVLFLFLFESLVSFIFRIDSLATRETIIAVLFLLVFWFLLPLESYIYIFGLRYQVGYIWCWFQLRKKVRRQV
jgi:hypothetical protein